MDVADLFDLATNLAHDAGSVDSLCSAAPTKCQHTRGVVFGPTSPRLGAAWEVTAIDNFARILLLVLFEAGERVAELLFALLERPIVIFFVFFPHAVPLALVLGLVTLGLVLEWKVSFDQAQPYLAGCALDLR